MSTSSNPAAAAAEMNPSLRYLAMGWKLHQEKKFKEAERAYRSALQLAPRNADILCHLGMVYHDQDRFDDAVNAYERALKERPDFPEVLNNLGNTLMRKVELDRSVECFREALRLKPDFPDAHMHMGVVLLMKGDFEEGWREYAHRFSTKLLRLPAMVKAVWDGSSLDGKTIALGAEQGLGDTIHFIRYAKRIKDKYPTARVLVACQRRLGDLLQGVPGVDQLVLSDPPPAFDEYAPLMSLPGIFNDDMSTFPGGEPYITPNAQLVEAWRQWFQSYSGVKIGLVWQGNPENPADSRRSATLSAFAPLGMLEGVELFGLQKGAGEDQVEQLGGRLKVVPLGANLDARTGAFVETAAVLKNLDLLISVDTATAHVAGALGVPTWLLLANAPDWRWQMQGDTTPWYPSMRLFRQTRGGSWSEVVQRMAIELWKRFPMVRPKHPHEFRLGSSGVTRLVALPDRLALYNRHDPLVGRSLEQYGEFNAGEGDVFRQLIRPGAAVVEADAGSGAQTVLLSEIVGETGAVFAWEGCRESFQLLNANAALNSRQNISAQWGVLGAESGTLDIPAYRYRRKGDAAAIAAAPHDKVKRETLDGFGLSRLDFLRTAEGSNTWAVLQGAAKSIAMFKPVIFAACPLGDERASVIEWLLANEYEAYWHTPALFRPDNTFGNPTNVFANAVAVNILAVHRSLKSKINGLPRIEKPTDDWKSAR